MTTTTMECRCVVSYWISTSNHNTCRMGDSRSDVVSYWISTSNHNCYLNSSRSCRLYLIEFLHQTTTCAPVIVRTMRCILLNFYIKPQRGFEVQRHGRRLYLIEFLHQTTTTGCVRIDFMAFMPGFPTEKNGFELRGSRFDVFFSYFKEQI